MNIFRNATCDRSYTKISNELINNPNLSAKAKGILIYLLSKPPDWEVRMEDIVAHMKDGLDSIKSGIKELKEAQFLVQRKKKNEAGQFVGWETLVFETPLPKVENPLSGRSAENKGFTPKVDFPTSENPTSENPTSENPPVYKEKNKEITKTRNNMFDVVEQKQVSVQVQENPASCSNEQKPTRSRSPRGRKKDLTAQEIYAMLTPEEMDRYEVFWDWYRNDICEEYGAGPGAKHTGVLGWLEVYRNGDWQLFRKGCAAFHRYLDGLVKKSGKAYGIPNIKTFFEGKKSNNYMPYWMVYLENSKPLQSSRKFLVNDFEPGSPQNTNDLLDTLTDEEREVWHEYVEFCKKDGFELEFLGDNKYAKKLFRKTNTKTNSYRDMRFEVELVRRMIQNAKAQETHAS